MDNFEELGKVEKHLHKAFEHASKLFKSLDAESDITPLLGKAEDLKNLIDISTGLVIDVEDLLKKWMNHDPYYDHGFETYERKM